MTVTRYLLLAHYDVSINKNVVKQEKLSRFWLLAAHLRQHAFANQKTIWNAKRLKNTQHK